MRRKPEKLAEGGVSARSGRNGEFQVGDGRMLRLGEPRLGQMREQSNRKGVEKAVSAQGPR